MVRGFLLAGALSAVVNTEAADSKYDAAAPADTGDEQQPAAAAAAAVTISTINFVDLAGSERGLQAAESGEKEKLRQKEVGLQTAELEAQRSAHVCMRLGGFLHICAVAHAAPCWCRHSGHSGRARPLLMCFICDARCFAGRQYQQEPADIELGRQGPG